MFIIVSIKAFNIDPPTSFAFGVIGTIFIFPPLAVWNLLLNRN